MGPRRGCRGRHDSAGHDRGGNARFNGAATRVSRKTWSLPWNGRLNPGGFNGAATRVSRKTVSVDSVNRAKMVLQWGRDEGVAEDTRSPGPRARAPSFNGAATRVSRKTRPGAGTRRHRTRRFNGAATRVSRKTHDALKSGVFNEVASMGPRRGCRGRPPSHSLSINCKTKLQWGRDEGVAEDTGRSARRRSTW